MSNPDLQQPMIHTTVSLLKNVNNFIFLIKTQGLLGVMMHL